MLHLRRLTAAALLAFTASAAQASGPTLPVAEPMIAPPAQARAHDWSGGHVGIVLAITRDRSFWARDAGDRSRSGDWRRGASGPNLGYSWQRGNMVYGGELDLALGFINADSQSMGTFDCGTGCRTRIDRTVTARARAGYAVDRALFYATAGVATARVEAQLNDVTLATEQRIGWAAGVGMEFVMTRRMRLRIEYLHTDLGRMPIAGCGAGCHTKVDFGALRLGLQVALGRRDAAPALPAANDNDWRGAYGGLRLGAVALGRNRHTANGGADASLPLHWTGATPQLSAGYNVQRGRLVAGVEVDASVGTVHGESHSSPTFSCSTSATCTTTVSRAMSLRARIGYARNGFLYFASAGAVRARVEAGTEDLGVLSSAWRNGYAVGMGLEYAVSRRTSVSVEYRMNRLGTLAIGAPCVGGCETNVNLSQLVVGLNYAW